MLAVLFSCEKEVDLDMPEIEAVRLERRCLAETLLMGGRLGGAPVERQTNVIHYERFNRHVWITGDKERRAPDPRGGQVVHHNATAAEVRFPVQPMSICLSYVF